MGATIDFTVNFWMLGLGLFNLLLVMLTFLSNRQKAATDDLKALKVELKADISLVNQQVAAQGERLSAIEADVENSPTHNDLGKVYDEIRKLSKEVAASMLTLSTGMAGLSSTLSAVEKQLGRMDTYWRNHDQ